MSQFEVRIGETVLKDEVADVVLQEFIFEHTMETRAAIILRLEKVDPSRLNLHWPAIVDEVDATRKRLFYGVVVEAYCAEGNKLVLACEDAKRYYEEFKARFGFQEFPVQEIVFYLARRVPEVEVQEKNIQGLSLKKSPRSFRVIMPILNMSVTERTSILGIQLLPKEGTSEDEEAIARFFSENGKTASQAGNNERPVWYETETRAELTLEATYFDEAAAEARRRVSRAVDWLSYILRLSVLGMRTDERLILVPWIRARSFAAVSVGQEAYVRDLSEPSLKACLYDFQPLKGDPSVALSASDLKAYSDVKELFQSISGKPTDLSRRFWSALHWLRRARESIDARDKLLDLWIALEFLVSEEAVPKLFSSTEVDALSEVLENEAMKLGVDGDLAARRFKEFVNQPSLRDRFDAFVQQGAHPIPIENREREVVWGPLRQARNDLEHGRRDVIIASEDLDVMEQMVSKMIWMLANEIGAASSKQQSGQW
ncbi:HEPN domain-containing protein [Candidatus Bathyarchaeota archaeon]|nr:HEPN domain-containing protein [Candidatus Bathyarchaeota archaeon]